MRSNNGDQQAFFTKMPPNPNRKDPDSANRRLRMQRNQHSTTLSAFIGLDRRHSFPLTLKLFTKQLFTTSLKRSSSLHRRKPSTYDRSLSRAPCLTEPSLRRLLEQKSTPSNYRHSLSENQHLRSPDWRTVYSSLCL